MKVLNQVGLEGTVPNIKILTRHIYLRKKSNLIHVWTILFLIDILLLSIFRGFFLTRSSVLLCDRCIVDSIVDLMTFTGDATLYKNKICEIFIRLLKPDYIFLMDVDEDVAFNRRDEEINVEYLKFRRNLYLEMAHRYQIIIINSELSFQKVHNKLLCHLTRIL